MTPIDPKLKDAVFLAAIGLIATVGPKSRRAKYAILVTVPRGRVEDLEAAIEKCGIDVEALKRRVREIAEDKTKPTKPQT